MKKIKLFIIFIILIIFFIILFINKDIDENFYSKMYLTHVISKKKLEYCYLQDYTTDKYIILTGNKFYLNNKNEEDNKEDKGYLFGTISTKDLQWKLFNTIGNKVFSLDFNQDNPDNSIVYLIDDLKGNSNQYIFYSWVSQFIYSYTYYGFPVYLYIKPNGESSWTRDISMATTIVFESK